MKKFILLLPAVMLCSCVNAKSVSFKSNLKVTRPLSDEQSEKFAEKYGEKAKTAKQIKISRYVLVDQEFDHEKISEKGTVDFYSNGMSSKVETKSDKQVDGVVYNAKDTLTQDAWVLSKDGCKSYAVVTEETGSNTPDVEVYGYEDNDEALMTVDFLVQALSDQDPTENPALYNNYQIFAKGAGYAVVFSDQQKIVNLAAAPSGTKEWVREINEQMIISIDKEFKVKEATYFYEMRTNRDPGTTEWFNGLQTVSKRQGSLSVAYGNLSERTDEAKLTAAVAKGDESYVVGIKPLVKLGSYSGTGTTPTASSFTTDAAFNEVSFAKDNAGFYTFLGKMSLTGNNTAVLRSAKFEAVLLTKEGFKTITSENSFQMTNTATLSNDLTSDSPGALPFSYKNANSGENYQVACTMSINTDDEVVGIGNTFLIANAEE